MKQLILRRLALLPFVAVGVTLLLFFLTQMLSPEIRASLYVKDPIQLDSLEDVIREHGLRDPAIKQYAGWVKRLARGELGYSETARMPVTEAIKAYLPATIELAVCAMIPVIFIGIWAGTLSAVKKGKTADQISGFIAITGYSMPTFVLGLLLLMIFYGTLGWLPPGRCSLATDMVINSGDFRHWTGFLTIDSLLNLNFSVFFDLIKHFVLPAATLCYAGVALMIRTTRSSMLEEMEKDYIGTARAKGLMESEVMRKHAGRNALISVMTMSGLQFVRLLGGVVITETVFDFPGIGRWGVLAAQQLDIPGVLGFSLMTAALLITGNLVTDLLYMYTDPRIRVS